jgi:sugar O-acyltransferase (sialic acid O-acetyltransferase NeuD family)
MDKKVYVFGRSGHAKVIIDLLLSLNFEILGLIDSFRPNNELVYGFPVLGDEFFFSNQENLRSKNIVIAVGNQFHRKMVYQKLMKINQSLTYPNIIYLNSIISPSVNFGFGNVVFHGCNVNSSSQIGNFCVLNTNSIIEHDCLIENFVNISPRATICGNVKIGSSSFIGASATIIQKINNENKVVVDAGSLVLSDVTESCLVVGVPAKIKQSNYNNINIL